VNSFNAICSEGEVITPSNIQQSLHVKLSMNVKGYVGMGGGGGGGGGGAPLTHIIWSSEPCTLSLNLDQIFHCSHPGAKVKPLNNYCPSVVLNQLSAG
jgi:hypothetical protein